MRRPSILMSGRCSLTPILRLLGRGFLAWTRILYFNARRHYGSQLGATQRNVLWRMRRNWRRTLLKPCSPWVIINTGCCVITGLPKPRSVASAKCYLAAARCHMRSAELPDARDTGMKALPTSSRPSALDPRNVELLTDATWTYAHASTIPGRAKAL